MFCALHNRNELIILFIWEDWKTSKNADKKSKLILHFPLYVFHYQQDFLWLRQLPRHDQARDDIDECSEKAAVLALAQEFWHPKKICNNWYSNAYLAINDCSLSTGRRDKMFQMFNHFLYQNIFVITINQDL